MSATVDTSVCFSNELRDSVVSELSGHVDESIATSQEDRDNLSHTRTLLEILTAVVATVGTTSLSGGRVKNWRMVVLQLIDEDKLSGKELSPIFVQLFDRLEWAVNPADIFKLVYLSRAIKPMTDAQLLEIMEVSRRNNRRKAITGLLLYYNQSIAQVLEGRKEDVENVYAKIRLDKRHTDCVQLMTEKKSYRDFPTWSMGYQRLDQSDDIHFDSYSELLEGGELPAATTEKLSAELTRLLDAFRSSAIREQSKAA